MQPIYYDIAVIGGGASGLAAAIEAKQCGGCDCRVAVIEKNTRLGKKILATGNGRCNLGNINENHSEHYSGSCVDLVEHLFRIFAGSEAFFKSLGVICRSDSGRLYPYSNHAASVLDALRFQLHELNIDTFTENSVLSIRRNKNFWEIKTNINTFIAKIIIAAPGGKAAPSMGTDGNFYKILRNIGHSYVPVSPALCPVYTEQSLLKNLKGIRVAGKVSLYNKKNKLINSNEGEVQFTEKSLSGICIFNLAAFINEDDMYIQIDLLPHLTESEINDLLWSLYAQRSSWKIEDMLSGVFQKKMCPALFNASRIFTSLNEPVYTLTPYDINQLGKTIKAWHFPIIQLAEWNQAQATSGGIPRNEIQSTLESSVCSNLYFAGEILDLVGECGGYNLAWAWCSGVCAARNAVNSLKEGEMCD